MLDLILNRHKQQPLPLADTGKPASQPALPPERPQQASQPIAATVVTQPVATRPTCPTCGSVELWQPHGSAAWYCSHCEPAPSRSLIAREIGQPVVIDICSYSVGGMKRLKANVCGNHIEFDSFETRPVCKCGSHSVVESTWSDGERTFACSSCQSPIPASLVS